MPPLPELRSPTLDAIYAAYEDEREDDERTYLGMSAIDSECARKLWYAFRWAHEPEALEGRKIRLFATGHREEERMIADLRRAGVIVQETDPETGEQWALQAFGGHLRGHMDAQVVGIVEAPKTIHVLECKTHNEKSFNALVKHGVKASKPTHYNQCQLYMHFSGLTRAFYLAHNKNTDALHAERIPYDAVDAIGAVTFAQNIITSDRAPSRLHDDPTAKAAFVCGWCPAASLCHHGTWARRNCRTCLHSTPAPGGAWRCERFLRELSLDEQKAGCPAHLFVPDLVPGEQINADAQTNTVTYRLRDGAEWVDGGAVP